MRVMIARLRRKSRKQRPIGSVKGLMQMVLLTILLRSIKRTKVHLALSNLRVKMKKMVSLFLSLKNRKNRNKRSCVVS